MEASEIEHAHRENGEESEQIMIRCVLQRGGTSKALYFHEGDLPIPGKERDALLLRLMGSPDVLQIDGLGGSRPITSKVAIISKSERPDADIDYTFAQVEIERAHVTWQGNCGNMGPRESGQNAGCMSGLEVYRRGSAGPYAWPGSPSR